MPACATRLRVVITDTGPRLLAMDEARTARSPEPGKWSPREIIGHLVDSASNNHQRFVRARFQDDMVFAGYDQDAWVSAQRYSDAIWSELVGLWSAFNLHLARVMETTPESVLTRERGRHNLDEIGWRRFPRERPVTLEAFMEDYVAHLEHHLGQIPGIR